MPGEEQTQPMATGVPEEFPQYQVAGYPDGLSKNWQYEGGTVAGGVGQPGTKQGGIGPGGSNTGGTVAAGTGLRVIIGPGDTGETGSSTGNTGTAAGETGGENP